MGDLSASRYTDRAFPDYRHVPGKTPHPTRDPEGHSYDRVPARLPNLNRHDWRQCDEYLFGIDLLNARYWWECHEVLEGLWHASGLGTPAGHALQAVIQCSAAHLKAESHCPKGAYRLLDRSLRHARWSGLDVLGLDLERLVMDTRTFLTVEGAAPAQVDLRF
jgi:hypothetical protein